MDAEVFDTRSLPLVQQFEAWQQWYGAVFETTPQRPVFEGYAARNLTWRFDGFALSRVTGAAIDGVRSPANIRRNPVDHWVITVTKCGTHKVLTRDMVAKPAIGVPLVQSLADPMESRRSDYDRVQLYMARDDFSDIAVLMDAVRDVPLDTTGGKLLAEYLMLLEKHLSALQQEETRGFKDALRAMVVACVRPAADRMTDAAGPIRATRLELVRRVVERHLRVSTLGPTMICNKVGLSRSQLYRLLEGEGGVSRYIQHKRLAAAYSELADPAIRRTISDIGLDLGFSDASSFSRAFRREFGLSPGDVRASPLERSGRTLAAHDRPPFKSNNFGDLIRCL